MYFDHTKTENCNFGIPDPYPSPLYLFQRLGHMRRGRDKGFVGMDAVYYWRADNNFAEGGYKMVGDGNLRTLGTESSCVEEPNFVGAESFCAARLENLNSSTRNCLGPLDPLPPCLPPTLTLTLCLPPSPLALTFSTFIFISRRI